MAKETGTVLKQDENRNVIQDSGYSMKYQAAAAANVVAKASAGFLKRIIIGKFVANGVLEVSDHATDGDGNIKIVITAAAEGTSAFPKVIEVGADFSAGICADIANFTDVTFIYR